MFSIGIDLVEIERIEKSLKTDGFLERFFGDDEIAEFEKRHFKAESIAAAFAAKEAFSKAVETGISGFRLCDVQLLHKQSGAPYLKLSGKAKLISETRNEDYRVSITHTGELAQATVIGFQQT